MMQLVLATVDASKRPDREVGETAVYTLVKRSKAHILLWICCIDPNHIILTKVTQFVFVECLPLSFHFIDIKSLKLTYFDNEL